jgi:hypothetical protein
VCDSLGTKVCSCSDIFQQSDRLPATQLGGDRVVDPVAAMGKNILHAALSLVGLNAVDDASADYRQQMDKGDADLAAGSKMAIQIGFAVPAGEEDPENEGLRETGETGTPNEPLAAPSSPHIPNSPG